MSICDDCYKKTVCKLTSPNTAGCIEYLPYKAVKQYWHDKLAKIDPRFHKSKEIGGK